MLRQALIRESDPLDAGRTCQIATESGLDDGSNYERILLSRGSSPGRFAGEFQAALRVGFPKIDAGAEPIVFVIARLKGLTFEQAFANFTVAAVITKNEGCRKAMQELAVMFGKLLARFCKDAGLNQGLSGRGGRSCHLCRILVRHLPKFIQRNNLGNIAPQRNWPTLESLHHPSIPCP